MKDSRPRLPRPPCTPCHLFHSIHFVYLAKHVVPDKKTKQTWDEGQSTGRWSGLRIFFPENCAAILRELFTPKKFFEKFQIFVRAFVVQQWQLTSHPLTPCTAAPKVTQQLCGNIFTSLKFLDPAKAMANLQKMPADAKVILTFHIISKHFTFHIAKHWFHNLTFAFIF